MEQNEVHQLTTGLLDETRAIFEVEIARDTATAPPLLKRVLAELPELRLDPQRPEPKQLPVCRHLSRALDLGEAGPAAPVAAVIRALEPDALLGT